jgi:hypothetical protein
MNEEVTGHDWSREDALLMTEAMRKGEGQVSEGKRLKRE